jgi:hypothetical protein
LECFTLEDWTVGFPDILVNSYHPRPTNIPEEQRPYQHHGGRLNALTVEEFIDPWS